MNARIQKHRIIRWLGRFVAALQLVLFATAFPAQAAVESVAPVRLWCNPYESTCLYATDSAAGQAEAVSYNFLYAKTNPYHGHLDFVSCDGSGYCTYNFVYDLWTVPNYILSIRNVYPTCPNPTANPTVPYQYNAATGMCVREAPCLALNVLNTSTGKCEPPEKLIITLYGGTTTEPGISLPFIAAVTNQDNQPPKNPVTVKISLKVDPTSGGHDHGTSDRPRGGIAGKSVCESDDTCWSQESPANNGAVVFNFNPTETSGKHTISATCDGCTNNPQTVTVNVKVKEADAAGWGQLTASSDYALVGAVTGKHTDNHYLTATARDHLMALVDKYNTKYPTVPVLRLNDASLEWGGKFDIQGKWDKDTAHKNHRRGVVIDIRANQDPTAIPQARFTDFEKFARNSNAYADLHCAFSGPYVCPACLLDTGSNRHYHVRLLGKSIDK